MKTTKSRNPKGQPKNDPRPVLAKRLTELRREKGLTVDEFAESLSAKPTTVRGWLNAKGLPRSQALLAIAERFHVTTDWLLGVDGAPKDPAYWHTTKSVESQTALAIKDRIRRQHGLSSRLLNEFVIVGSVALDVLAETAESEILRQAENIQSMIQTIDAGEALINAFPKLKRPPTSQGPIKASAKFEAATLAMGVLEKHLEAALASITPIAGSIGGASSVASPQMVLMQPEQSTGDSERTNSFDPDSRLAGDRIADMRRVATICDNWQLETEFLLDGYPVVTQPLTSS